MCKFLYISTIIIIIIIIIIILLLLLYYYYYYQVQLPKLVYVWVRNLEFTIYFINTMFTWSSPSNPTNPLSFIEYVLIFSGTEYCNYV